MVWQQLHKQNKGCTDKWKELDTKGPISKERYIITIINVVSEDNWVPNCLLCAANKN